MKVNHLVYNRHLIKRIIQKLKFRFPDSKCRFDTDKTRFPVEYVFVVEDHITDFRFTHDEIKELCEVSKYKDNPYGFVIETFFNSCLGEIRKLNYYN